MHYDGEEFTFGFGAAETKTAPPAVPPWPDASSLLRPRLRPATFPAPRWPLDDDAISVIQRPFSSFVHEFVAVDLPDHRLNVTRKILHGWGVTAEQVFFAARQNIAQLHPVGEDRYQPVSADELRRAGWEDQDISAGGDVLRAGAMIMDADRGGTYLASAILTPGWLAAIPADGHRPVWFMPTEETIIIGSDDPATGAKSFEMAEECYLKADHPVSPQGFTVYRNTVKPFDEAGPHPLRAQALRARACVGARQYEEQTEFLREAYLGDLIDVYVAAAQVLQAPDGMALNAVWGEGLTYDLPEVDYVSFVNDDGLHFTVPFPVLVEVLGIQPTPGLYPTRYRVAGWPEPAAMDALRFHAVQLEQA